MNDLDICKRIAEIEGVKIDVLGGKAILDEMLGGVRIRLTEYNPLKDDALTFKLMVKYDVDIISPYRPNGDTQWEAQAFTAGCTDTVNAYNESPNKAICLVIIEANKEK